MYQVSNCEGKKSPFISLIIQKPKISLITQELNANVRSRFLNNSDMTHSRFTESKLGSLERDPIKENSISGSQKEEKPCKDCQKWKDWALKQQKVMLQLQKTLTVKESKLIEVMSKQQKQITTNNETIKQLELLLKNKKQQITKLEQSIQEIQKKFEQFSQQNLKCQTPKKENKKKMKSIDSYDFKNLEIMQLNNMQNTEQIRYPTKTSGITTLAEGWHCSETLKKEPIQKQFLFRNADQNGKQRKQMNKTVELYKSNELQRCLFENQTLKDYNTALLERLRTCKYKKLIC